jgi:pyrimidine operon attenuation protein / uracil phosphoribosyltransferase
MSSKTLILTSSQIQHKLERIAWQIFEDNYEETELLLVAILPRGKHLAQSLKSHLDNISSLKTDILELKVDKDAQKLIFKTDKELSVCQDKSIVIVDDVLNTGKTLAYAASIFADYPIKKLRTAILVNRNHRLYPITADFVGLNISTILQDHVSVEFDAKLQASAYLM